MPAETFWCAWNISTCKKCLVAICIQRSILYKAIFYIAIYLYSILDISYNRPDTKRKTERLIFGSVFTWHWYSPISLSWNKLYGDYCGDDEWWWILLDMVMYLSVSNLQSPTVRHFCMEARKPGEILTISVHLDVIIIFLRSGESQNFKFVNT